jgi:hypothetical protein
MDEKLFRELDEVSRKLDGLSRTVEHIAYRASGKRVPQNVESGPPASELKAAIAKFTFALEYRGEAWVLQEKNGGCRPATMYEVVLWSCLQQAATQKP